MFVHFSSVYI